MCDNRSHPGVAAVLSFIFNGLGQIYNGKIKKGLFIMSLSSASLILIVIGAVIMGYVLFTGNFVLAPFVLGAVLFVMGIIAACVIGSWSIFDAYKGY